MSNWLDGPLDSLCGQEKATETSMGAFVQSENLTSKKCELNCPLEALIFLTISSCLED